ncbi:MAG: hypothetical protein KAR32_13810, partial [Candidatus Omnitrophica bacterium]|nr:hypothetical protein [Candidatus Omnitrophota bacterium]
RDSPDYFPDDATSSLVRNGAVVVASSSPVRDLRDPVWRAYAKKEKDAKYVNAHKDELVAMANGTALSENVEVRSEEKDATTTVILRTTPEVWDFAPLRVAQDDAVPPVRHETRKLFGHPWAIFALPNFMPIADGSADADADGTGGSGRGEGSSGRANGSGGSMASFARSRKITKDEILNVMIVTVDTLQGYQQEILKAIKKYLYALSNLIRRYVASRIAAKRTAKDHIPAQLDVNHKLFIPRQLGALRVDEATFGSIRVSSVLAKAASPVEQDALFARNLTGNAGKALSDQLQHQVLRKGGSRASSPIYWTVHKVPGRAAVEIFITLVEEKAVEEEVVYLFWLSQSFLSRLWNFLAKFFDMLAVQTMSFPRKQESGSIGMDPRFLGDDNEVNNN